MLSPKRNPWSKIETFASARSRVVCPSMRIRSGMRAGLPQLSQQPVEADVGRRAEERGRLRQHRRHVRLLVVLREGGLVGPVLDEGEVAGVRVVLHELV